MSKQPEAVAAIHQRYQEWMTAIRERDLETILSIYVLISTRT
jgi:ketosteroid isomerase-like protein